MDSLGLIIVYFIMALAVVVFSVMAVTTRRILRSATYLLFVLLATAVFYFQLGYQFLGAVQIAVYAGGIMVLFVFAILLTSKPGERSEKLASHRRWVGITSSVAGAVVLIWALCHMPICSEGSLTEMLGASSYPDMHNIGRALVGSDKYQYLLPLEAVSVLLLACIIGGVAVARKK